MIDLPHLTGVIPRDAELAIYQLRAAIEALEGQVSRLQRGIKDTTVQSPAPVQATRRIIPDVPPVIQSEG